MAFGLVFYTLTVVAVGGQIALKDYIGNVGCKIYTLSGITTVGWFIFGGFGVAIFRMLCLRDQTMTEKMRASIVKKLQVLEVLLLTISYLPLLLTLMSNDKWEIMPIYRVCIDENLLLADVRLLY